MNAQTAVGTHAELGELPNPVREIPGTLGLLAAVGGVYALQSAAPGAFAASASQPGADWLLANFGHHGPRHLAMNAGMIALGGVAVERHLGSKALLAVASAAMIASALSLPLLTPGVTAAAGASGVSYALAVAGLLSWQGSRAGWPMAAVLVIQPAYMIAVAGPVAGGVLHSWHLAGALVGLVAVLFSRFN